MLRYKYLRPRYLLYRFRQNLDEASEVRRWERAGKPFPPPSFVKHRAVRRYRRRFHLHTLIETGTYTGGMVYAMQDEFDRIYTIELDDALFRAATERLAKFAHVTPLHGDSGEVLPRLLADISEPCVFWLDGHYSGEGTARGESDTPVLKELRAIFDHPIKNHVVLIDDVHCFTGENGYPTIDQLREIVKQAKPDWHFAVADGIIRAHPDPQQAN